MASNFFLEFSREANIKGECAVDGHKDAVEVLSWSHSFNQPTSPTRSSAGGGTVEQANHSDFSFTKYIDRATDAILKHCWNGKAIKDAKLVCYRNNGDKRIKYLTVEFANVIISNYSISGGGGDMPSETVTMSYSKVKYVYFQQMPDADPVAKPVTHDLALFKVE